MQRNDLVALSHALGGCAVLVVSLLTKTDFMGPREIMKPLGMAIFALGMLLFVVAVFYLRKGFLGNVDPATETVVKTGPYRWVRHPIYLGMVIAMLGIALGMRSLWGLVSLVALFVPLCILRAKLEEQALARKFGEQWTAYTRRTHFMFPPFF